MCGGGGGAGGSGTQRYEWNPEMADDWADMIAWGRGLTNPEGFGQYDRYPGQRIAFMNQDQVGAMDGIRAFAGSGGDGPTRDARGHLQQTLTDHYLTGEGANPYASAGNPNAGMRNQYSGDSDQFRSLLQAGQEDIVGAYQRGTSADTTRLMNLSGAFGGSAHQNAIANNEQGLARELGRYTAGMQNDQFNRSAGLEENFINRNVQGEENRLARATGAFEGERGRQVGSLGAAQNDQNLTLDRYRSLMSIGDVQRAYQQDFLNQGYNDWQEENNHQYRMLDYMTGLLGRAQGGMSPNMTYTTPGYSASPYSQLLGAGLLAAGAFGGR